MEPPPNPSERGAKKPVRSDDADRFKSPVKFRLQRSILMICWYCYLSLSKSLRNKFPLGVILYCCFELLAESGSVHSTNPSFCSFVRVFFSCPDIDFWPNAADSSLVDDVFSCTNFNTFPYIDSCCNSCCCLKFLPVKVEWSLNLTPPIQGKIFPVIDYGR